MNWKTNQNCLQRTVNQKQGEIKPCIYSDIRRGPVTQHPCNVLRPLEGEGMSGLKGNFSPCEGSF